MVKEKAVRRIQSVWKGYMYEKGARARCAPLVKAWINNAATTIQKAWRKYAESREYAEKKKIDAWLHAVSVSRVYKDSAKYYLQDHVFSDYVLDNTFPI